MVCLSYHGLLQDEEPVSPTTAEEVISILGESSLPMELNNTEGRESYDLSIHAGVDACLLPFPDDQFTGDKHRKNTFFRWAQALVPNMTSRRGGGMCGEVWLP